MTQRWNLRRYAGRCSEDKNKGPFGPFVFK